MRCVKTELYFGDNEPGGKSVTAKEWQAFLKKEVTPRFPRGMTAFDAYGQMQHKSGRIERQETRMIVLVYKAGSVEEKRVEEVIAAYRARFENAQVMHLRSTVEAEFFAD